jgi:hypothetical protein
MHRPWLLAHHPEMAQRQVRLQVRPVLFAGMPEKGKTGDRANDRACSVTLINWALLARFDAQTPPAGQIPRRTDFQPHQRRDRITFGTAYFHRDNLGAGRRPMEPANLAC